MNVRIRITRDLYHAARADLTRPHAFAGERVGFLFSRMGNAGSNDPLILCTQYAPVADDNYINDPTVGARINGTAIRAVMQRILDRQEGAFHVHMHPTWRRLGFSTTDQQELPRLIPSFQAVGPTCAHGLLLFDEHDADCIATVWLPQRTTPVAATRISVVGYPMRLFGRA